MWEGKGSTKELGGGQKRTFAEEGGSVTHLPNTPRLQTWLPLILMTMLLQRRRLKRLLTSPLMEIIHKSVTFHHENVTHMIY